MNSNLTRSHRLRRPKSPSAMGTLSYTMSTSLDGYVEDAAGRRISSPGSVGRPVPAGRLDG